MTAVAEAVELVEVVGAGTVAAHTTAAGAAMTPVVADGAGTDAVPATTAGEAVAPADAVGAGTDAGAATTPGVAVTSVAAVATAIVTPPRLVWLTLAVWLAVPVAPPAVSARVVTWPERLVLTCCSRRSVWPLGGVHVVAPPAIPLAKRSSRASAPGLVMVGVVTVVVEPLLLLAWIGVVVAPPDTATMMTMPFAVLPCVNP
ncbi:hypothetical protein [Nonomuraea rubra]|uniref:hypothetical protein n=2 Tax=Streptosporangiaceae TaxID=2004 RepID=UPI003409A38D